MNTSTLLLNIDIFFNAALQTFVSRVFYFALHIYGNVQRELSSDTLTRARYYSLLLLCWRIWKKKNSNIYRRIIYKIESKLWYQRNGVLFIFSKIQCYAFHNMLHRGRRTFNTIFTPLVTHTQNYSHLRTLQRKMLYTYLNVWSTYVLVSINKLRVRIIILLINVWIGMVEER